MPPKKTSTRSPHGATITQFPGNAMPVTPSDVTEYPDGISLFVSTGGTVVVEPATKDGADQVTFNNIPDGSMVPVMVRRVYATGTNAQGIVGIF